jgi:hypothetical protein
VDSGEFLGIYEVGGSFEMTVTNQEPPGTECAFQGIELVSTEEAAGGVVVRGVEAVRINELMVEPTTDFLVSNAAFNNPQGSDWTCNGGVCSNSGVGSASWTWTSDQLRDGRHYLNVWAGQSGQTVGEVCLGSSCQLLVHGQRHPDTIVVTSDGKFSLTIGKTAQEGTYYLEKVTLSLQPDGEYVELINLTDDPGDVGGWTLEGEGTLGRVAQLPAGTILAGHGFLVAAVDVADAQAGLEGNGIDASSAWEFPAGSTAVQLMFAGNPPSPDDDWLKTTLPSGSRPQLALRNGSILVDEVEYPLSSPSANPFQSLEKGDPSVVNDNDGDGLDDEWFPALRLYTPGTTNENDGTIETQGLEQILHDPAAEVRLLNRPLQGVGEVAGVPSGIAWKPFTSEDLSRLVDRLTVDGLRLEAEGHLIEGAEQWHETSDGHEYNSSQTAEGIGSWQWTELADGQYRMSLYGWSQEQLSARWQRADLSYTAWSPPLSTDVQGRIVLGQISIGLEETPPAMLTLQVQCASGSGICHLDHVRLDPRLVQVGLINVNTASREVLTALPGMTEALASRLIDGRPYGNQEEKGRGIGDLLREDILGSTEEDKIAVFQQMAHLLTVRSQVFRILSLGQALHGQIRTATQRIQAVVQRQ